MKKKLFIVFVVAFVIFTAIVGVLSSHGRKQRRPPPRPAQTEKTLSLDTSPPQFPQR
jgi:hypothetical protein